MIKPNNLNYFGFQQKVYNKNNNLLRKIGTNIITPNNNIQYNRPKNNPEQKTYSRYQNLSKNNTSNLNNINLNNNSKLKNNNYYINKLPINLEDLLIQEENLWMILTCLRINGDFSKFSEEYIQFSHLSSIQSFEIYFEEPKQKLDLKINLINEYISVMLSLYSIILVKLNENSLSHLKNLFYYIYQNFLIIISLILSKVNKEYNYNIWGNRLKEVLNIRLNEEIKNDKYINNNEFFYINQNNTIITNMLRNFIIIYFKTKNPFDSTIYNFINMILVNYQNNHNNIDLWYIKTNMNKIKLEIINSMMYKQVLSSFNSPAKAPFLPPLDKNKYTYSLVLDLDETLVHTLPETNKTLIRPGVDTFLKELAPFFEIIIFTAGVQEYADSLLNQIDKEHKLIQHRLYRQHCTFEKSGNVKDMSKLGRDLSKVIIIDNISDNFKIQSQNGIFITPWLGNENDNELFQLIPILKEISVKQVDDVRKILRKIRDKMIKIYLNGDKCPIDTLKKMMKESDDNNNNFT